MFPRMRAGAQENRDGVAITVRHRQIELAIAIEIAQRDRLWTAARAEESDFAPNETGWTAASGLSSPPNITTSRLSNRTREKRIKLANFCRCISGSPLPD
jgi:hypothetical protein